MCSRYSNNKEINQMIRNLLREGWSFQNLRRHKKLIAPSGQSIVFSGSPSDENAHRQFERDIRKISMA